jgi:molybdopterin-containing oxidoreductase family membrane subunit
MLATYITAKIIDTIYWATVTAPSTGFAFLDFYTNNPGSWYGLWILIAEIVLGGIVPAAILITDKGRKTQATLWLAVILAVMGVCLNRWVMVLQVLAIPVLTFDTWALYWPSWQEVATTLLPVALGTISISISYRYLPIFPQELELNPPDSPAAEVTEAQPEAEEAPAGEPEPAEA